MCRNFCQDSPGRGGQGQHKREDTARLELLIGQRRKGRRDAGIAVVARASAQFVYPLTHLRLIGGRGVKGRKGGIGDVGMGAPRGWWRG